jgi:hypothetical protein
VPSATTLAKHLRYLHACLSEAVPRYLASNPVDLAVGVAVANQPWFWAVADAVALTLLFLNVLASIRLDAVRCPEVGTKFGTKRSAAPLTPTSRGRNLESLKRLLLSVALILPCAAATAVGSDAHGSTDRPPRAGATR